MDAGPSHAPPCPRMISNDLDLEHWRRALASRSRVQIPGFLQPAAAEALAQDLEQRVPWQLAERSAGASRTTPRGAYPQADEYDALIRRGYAQAATSYQFAYDSYMLVKAAQEAWDPELLVNRMLTFFNGADFIEFARYLASDPAINAANAQCTRYRPGHYLMPHEDLDVSEGRRYAFVINLAREWRQDWGGQLQFLGDDGSVTETFMPGWNMLSLFRVPQRHQVTLVSPWASRPRHAITGWWLAR